jgi:pimeloyl-ACP methyl ester carboxylesterase
MQKFMILFLTFTCLVTACAQTVLPGATELTVRLGKRTLGVSCAGAGQPLVLLESGLGETRTAWRNVWSDLSRLTRTCAYDRAGLGSSTPAAIGRKLEDVVNDELTVIAKINPAGQTLVVGHSLGGLIALETARRYPVHVQGLVLLDSSHPNMEDRLASVRPKAFEEVWQRLIEQNPPEPWDFAAATRQGANAATSGILGHLPLRVLTRGAAPTEAEVAIYRSLYPTYTRQMLEREETEWRALQSELGRLSSAGQQRLVSGARHHVQDDRPEAVIAAVQSIVETLR